MSSPHEIEVVLYNVKKMLDLSENVFFSLDNVKDFIYAAANVYKFLGKSQGLIKVKYKGWQKMSFIVSESCEKIMYFISYDALDKAAKEIDLVVSYIASYTGFFFVNGILYNLGVGSE